jgi:hypothetical protein
VVLHADGAAIPATAIVANDAETIQLVSDAIEAKYGRRSPGSTAQMRRPHTLETTMRVEPARDPESRASG